MHIFDQDVVGYVDLLSMKNFFKQIKREVNSICSILDLFNVYLKRFYFVNLSNNARYKSRKQKVRYFTDQNKIITLIRSLTTQ